ncbi:hypothetical protein H9P43_008950 [Blastocladiella emersonii ATCC 22665]|nr:hypothetical protein H9P43_008950 [Blastocladiella emersonii ATCC 22665]
MDALFAPSAPAHPIDAAVHERPVAHHAQQPPHARRGGADPDADAGTDSDDGSELSASSSSLDFELIDTFSASASSPSDASASPDSIIPRPNAATRDEDGAKPAEARAPALVKFGRGPGAPSPSADLLDAPLPTPCTSETRDSGVLSASTTAAAPVSASPPAPVLEIAPAAATESSTPSSPARADSRTTHHVDLLPTLAGFTDAPPSPSAAAAVSLANSVSPIRAAADAVGVVVASHRDASSDTCTSTTTEDSLSVATTGTSATSVSASASASASAAGDDSGSDIDADEDAADFRVVQPLDSSSILFWMEKVLESDASLVAPLIPTPAPASAPAAPVAAAPVPLHPDPVAAAPAAATAHASTAAAAANQRWWYKWLSYATVCVCVASLVSFVFLASISLNGTSVDVIRSSPPASAPVPLKHPSATTASLADRCAGFAGPDDRVACMLRLVEAELASLRALASASPSPASTVTETRVVRETSVATSTSTSTATATATELRTVTAVHEVTATQTATVVSTSTVRVEVEISRPVPETRTVTVSAAAAGPVSDAATADVKSAAEQAEPVPADKNEEKKAIQQRFDLVGFFGHNLKRTFKQMARDLRPLKIVNDLVHPVPAVVMGAAQKVAGTASAFWAGIRNKKAGKEEEKPAAGAADATEVQPGSESQSPVLAKQAEPAAPDVAKTTESDPSAAAILVVVQTEPEAKLEPADTTLVAAPAHDGDSSTRVTVHAQLARVAASIKLYLRRLAAEADVLAAALYDAAAACIADPKQCIEHAADVAKEAAGHVKARVGAWFQERQARRRAAAGTARE